MTISAHRDGNLSTLLAYDFDQDPDRSRFLVVRWDRLRIVDKSNACLPWSQQKEQREWRKVARFVTEEWYWSGWETKEDQAIQEALDRVKAGLKERVTHFDPESYCENMRQRRTRAQSSSSSNNGSDAMNIVTTQIAMGMYD